MPIIFRPYHEAEGNTNTVRFWFLVLWGKSGAVVYIETLEAAVYGTCTEEYGIHNLIWEYNSYDYSDFSAVVSGR